MARGVVEVIFRQWPGMVVALIVLAVLLGSLAAVIGRADGFALGPADWAAVRFTVAQALVSALVSVVLAIPVARALARRRFVGRGALVTLLGAPFILPVIVAILGLLAVFGRGGMVNAGLAVLGFETVSIYGFSGVVLAHVFFNLPLATRFLLQGWLAIPAERFRLAASLNAPIGRLLEWPMLRAVLPGAFLVIFLICLTSFAVALTLGGGPRATTVELAIYQAMRFDFDLGRAALLAVVQFTISAAAALLAWRVALPGGFGAGLDRTVARWDGGPGWLDAAVITLAAAFLLLPLAMIVWRGVPGLVALPDAVWAAAGRSLIVALVSTGLVIVMALALALRGGRLIAIVGVLPLAASSLVVGTGLFVILYRWVSPAAIALPVTALLNAIMALPFALRVLEPAVAQVQASFGALADTLDMRGWARLRWVLLPRLRRPLGFAAGLAAALSMGDLGVIALFADAGQATLPLVMYRLMGAYRMESAAGTGLLLIGLSLGLFWVFDRGGRVDADA